MRINPSSSTRPLPRSLRLAAIMLGVGLVALTGQARAADDNDDETIEEKVIGGIMRGLGGTNMENTGIEYRERSPLVVPPRIDLPPPSASAETNVANWPKDPDVQRRKVAREAAKKSKPLPWEQGRSLPPSELAQKSTGAPGSTEAVAPGNGQPILSPSQLGFTGFKSMFGGTATETAPFTGEPTRDSLTQPPVGYQTPSPAYAYGTGPKGSLNNTGLDVMSGKEVKY